MGTREWCSSSCLEEHGFQGHPADLPLFIFLPAHLKPALAFIVEGEDCRDADVFTIADLDLIFLQREVDWSRFLNLRFENLSLRILSSK
jgi:hypothetical protein